MPTEQNTKVYVSNLPTDITEEEFVEMMSKYGMIFRDPASNKMKIKLYAEADGQVKGDGLCDYIRVSRYFIVPIVSIKFYKIIKFVPTKRKPC